MQLASFTLTSVDHYQSASAALAAQPGVKEVLAGDNDDACSVVYDDELTTPAQLQQALAHAGYPNTVAEPVRGCSSGGSCCGGCGGNK